MKYLNRYAKNRLRDIGEVRVAIEDSLSAYACRQDASEGVARGGDPALPLLSPTMARARERPLGRADAPALRALGGRCPLDWGNFG